MGWFDTNNISISYLFLHYAFPSSITKLRKSNRLSGFCLVLLNTLILGACKHLTTCIEKKIKMLSKPEKKIIIDIIKLSYKCLIVYFYPFSLAWFKSKKFVWSLSLLLLSLVCVVVSLLIFIFNCSNHKKHPKVKGFQVCSKARPLFKRMYSRNDKDRAGCLRNCHLRNEKGYHNLNLLRKYSNIS